MIREWDMCVGLVYRLGTHPDFPHTRSLRRLEAFIILRWSSKLPHSVADSN